MGHEALEVSFPDPFNLSLQKVATVNAMRDDQDYNLRFRRPLNDWEVGQMVEFLNILKQCKDLNNSEDFYLGF